MKHESDNIYRADVVAIGALLQGSEVVAEVELERSAGLQALGEQGGRAGLGRIRGD